MEDLQLLVDFHKEASRQGPGSSEETRRAIELAAIEPELSLKVADIGCGTGASTLVLAQQLNATITAVDFMHDFLKVLETNAEAKGLANKIDTLACSMDCLPFKDEELDIIWSEGAIYNMGFEKGVRDWRRFLKPGGLLVVSELSWLTTSRPVEIDKHWTSQYPEINAASSKFQILEESGYSPRGYFVLPDYCWLENYYEPMQNRFQEFLVQNNNSEGAKAIVEAERREIELYKKYSTYYGYGVYIARKL